MNFKQMRFFHQVVTYALLALLATLAACTENTPLSKAAKEVERELAWVESANASSMYHADLVEGKNRFLAVCGYACMVPSVGSLTAERCFPRVTVDEIKGTSDVRLSERHSALIEIAWEVAVKYNALVAEGQSQQGLSKCPINANFDGAFRDLHALVMSVHSSASERALSLEAHAPAFHLVVPHEVATVSFEQAACAVLSKHNLPSEALLYVTFEPGSGVAPHIVSCKSAT